MISLFLILMPLIGLAAVWCAGGRLKVHVAVINITAVLHVLGTAALWIMPDLDKTLPANVQSLIGQDGLSLVVLSVVSFIFVL